MTDIFGMGLGLISMVVVFLVVVVYVGTLLPSFDNETDDEVDDPPWWNGI